MCKATKKADAYSIIRDAKTRAFNVSFNGVYSKDVQNFMYEHGFRWSKSNACFYGWTKEIQAISNQLQKLVFDWRNVKIEKNFIECPLILENEIPTVEVYKNHRDYVAACKRSDYVHVVSLLEDLPFDPAPEVIDHLNQEEKNNTKEELPDFDIHFWYVHTYPTDELGDDLKPGVTFNDVIELLQKHEGERFYDVTGACDSVIRERIFAKIAEMLHVTYNDVYDMWLAQPEPTKKDIHNRDELIAAIDEAKQNYIHWCDDVITTWAQFMEAIDQIAKTVMMYYNLGTYKRSEYDSELGLSPEDLKKTILYTTYNAEETAKHVKVTRVDEYRRGVNFCGLKCCDIDEALKYIEEDRHNFEPTDHVMNIQAYVDFDSELEYEKFVHLGLMVDQSWLTGEDNHFGGGAYCYLKTLECFTHETDSKLSHEVYYMKTEERRAKGIGYMTAGVIVRHNGAEKIAIDPEGYSYARYIGILPTEEVVYTEPENDFWLTDEEKQFIKDAQAGREWSIIDFGARRSKNENFWNELKKYGTIKLDSCMWSFHARVAA